MMLNLFFAILFLIGLYYLIHYRIRIEKAVNISREAIFPVNKEQFSKILIPNDWKEMELLSRKTKSYKLTHWGTIIAIILLGIIFILLATDKTKIYASNIVYFFLLFFHAIRHPGNLFIFHDGVILNSKYYGAKEIKNVNVEQIIRWHDLYGLHDRLNNAYKLEFTLKRSFFNKQYVVVEDKDLLEQILQLLKEQGIPIEETKKD